MLPKHLCTRLVFVQHTVCTERLHACQVINIDTSERVWLPGISSNSDQFGMGYFKRNSFGSERQDAVVVTDDAAIPL